MCKSALLFSNKNYALGDRLRQICRNQKVNLIYTLTFPELLHNMITSRPEVVFFDAEGVMFNYELYKDFVKSRYFDIPKIVAISPNPESYSFKDENIIILDKKNFYNQVENILERVEEKKSKKMDQERIDKSKNDTAKLLQELGITTKYLGYAYIKELVVDIISDRRMLKSFNTKLYPKIASKYNTQINNIERNIRNVISVAKKNCKEKNLYSDICGKFNPNGIPSNKQFITWIVEEVS